MKTILSLFDHSGQWSAPFEAAGYEVIRFDIQNNPPLDVSDLCVEYFQETLGIEWVDGILGAPPCTDFVNSGAWRWAFKDANGQTEFSIELVRQLLRCIEYWKPDWWALENPIGRLPKLVTGLGKPFRFDPCDFAGWVDASPDQWKSLEEIRARHFSEYTGSDIAQIKRLNAYTKRTCLWGRFNNPAPRRVEPIRACKQGSWLQRIGGPSARTKAARSETPEGFSQAFFAANNWTVENSNSWAAECAAVWLIEMAECTNATDNDLLAMFDPDEHPHTDPQSAIAAYRHLADRGVSV